MKSFLMFLLLAVIVGGIIWYENQPQTVKIPVETDDQIDYQPNFYEESTTTRVEVTQQSQPEVDYSDPDVRLHVEGVNGDEVSLIEVIGKPKHLGDLREDVRSVLMGCPDVTDRDMVVKVDAKLELLSALPAKVSVDYRTIGHAAVYNFAGGMECDDGTVSHELTPDKNGHIAYWVVITGVVTPDHPDGDFDNLSVVIPAPNLTLPNLEKMFFEFWGPRVMGCEGDILGPAAKIWLAGRTPVGVEGNWDMQNCHPANSEAAAVTNK